MAVNARYGELQHTSHIYETIPDKQETGPKKNEPLVYDYCFTGNATIKPQGVSFDRKSDTIKSDNVPTYFELENHCSSNEVTNPHYSSHSKPMSSKSQPSDAQAEAHNDVSAGGHVPQYASLDTASRDPVSEYQKSTIQPLDPSIHVTPNHITKLL